MLRWRMTFGGLASLPAMAAVAAGIAGQEVREWTAAERDYLAGRASVSVCADPNYAPFDFIDGDGRHRGIAADLLDGISALIGVPMHIVPSADWAGTLELAQRGECDLVAMLNETAARAEYLNFTRPYVTFENAIVTHRPAYHHGLASLAGRTLALPHSYRLVELIAAEYPDIEVVRVESAEAALRAVSRGDAWATLVNHQRLIRDVQRLRLRNVHFAGEAGVPDHYRIGVRKDDEMLLGIIDAALAATPPHQLSRIMERWYVVPVESTVDWRLVLTVAAVAAALLAFLLLHLYHRQRYYTLLERQNAELETLSETDPLTQTANRRRLDARLTEEIERTRRYHRPLAVLMFDLDDFKLVNDRYGHRAGDAVLVGVAGLMRQQQRLTDVLGRWGGEEFLLICSETELHDACIVAERIRQAIATHAFGDGHAVTVSVGVAAAQEADTPESLLQRADEALYRAKAAGRNSVQAEGGTVQAEGGTVHVESSAVHAGALTTDRQEP